MGGLTRRAARRTAGTVKKVEREPRDLTGQRRQTFPVGGKSIPGKWVKITNTGNGKRKTAIGTVVKIEVEEHEGIAAGKSVTVTTTSETLEIVNPRDNYLQLNALYMVFKISGVWTVDNAGFQEWTS